MTAWLGMIVVAGVWFVHLAASYFLAWADCATNHTGLLIARHLVTMAALAVTIAVGSLSHRISSPPVETERVLEQSFMMRLNVALSLMFLFAVVLAGATNLVLAPCVK